MKTQKEAAAYDTEVRKYCDRAMAKADLFTPMIDHQEMMFQRMISHADHGSNMAFALARMTLRRMKQVYPAQSMRIEVSHNDAEVTMHYRGANPNYVPPKDIFQYIVISKRVYGERIKTDDEDEGINRSYQ